MSTQDYCTVVFSNVYSDEVLLKIGAILLLYEQEVPEELLTLTSIVISNSSILYTMHL